MARRGWTLNVFLLTKAKAKALKTKSEKPTIPEVKPRIVSQPLFPPRKPRARSCPTQARRARRFA